MHDEARAALEALSFYARGFSDWWWPGEQESPALYGAINGLLFRCFGPTLETFRSANATWTLLTAVVLYAYIKRSAGPLLGFATAVVFLHCMWVAHMSRWGFTMSWSSPMIPVLWLSILIWSGILSRVTEVPKAHRILPLAPVLFVGAESLRSGLPMGGPVQIVLHARYRGFLDALSAEVGTTATVVRDPRSGELWWTEALLPDASRVRRVLAERPDMVRTDPPPHQPGL